MRKTMRSRILLYFLVVSLSGILLTSFSILWGFEDHFNSYLREGREKNINLIKEEILKEYDRAGILQSNQVLSMLHNQAMTENLFYRIYDSEGKLLLDTTNMKEMMENMAQGTQAKIQEEQLSETYRLSSGNRFIGSIKVYYQEELLEEDFSFFHTIKRNIYAAALITLILSAIFSLLFSKWLSSGFNKLSVAVQELQKHKWNTRLNIEEFTEEMKPVGLSFNHLASSLSKEENLRKQFTADLAHELRTPLATLRSQIEAFQDEIWEPTPRKLQQSHDELMRLVRLVNELEKLLAAENPQIKLNKINIEANKIVNTLKDLFAPSFHEKGVKLRILNSEEEQWFQADRDRVIQILTNVIQNALQHTPSGNRVTISVIKENSYIGFSVADTGVGIKKEDLPYLFERFYRGDKSRNRKTGGIGIGLSIVKALVNAHEGKINIKSEINAGTTLTVLFPINKDNH
ncbi:HAMP domain-containing histidine kinase [Cytobacillus firmus]|uniref:sensor histidine kinase n=1 Tax=Cytobacillus TaxID=2675230 RepID=UPI0021C5E694|nr:HAMP domain-containing sensor histidine kinase [Cytobacillus firmus]MCU1808192.1 HAMP domain-containing histidine kinase [Cytobacillus firmus]